MIGFARIYARSQITEDHPPFVYNECMWIYGQHEYSRLSALFYNVIVRENSLYFNVGTALFHSAIVRESTVYLTVKFIYPPFHIMITWKKIHRIRH